MLYVNVSVNVLGIYTQKKKSRRLSQRALYIIYMYMYMYMYMHNIYIYICILAHTDICVSVYVLGIDTTLIYIDLSINKSIIK